MISLGGELDLDTVELEVARLHGGGEDLHLGAVVVEVELAVHVVSHHGQQVAQGVAEGGPATVADVQGADGVRGHELDVHALPLAEVPAPVVPPLAGNAGQFLEHPVPAQGEVDKTGPRHLHRLQRSRLARGGVLLYSRLQAGG